jgi:hypothetical protein
MMRRSAWLLVVGVGLSLLAAGMVSEWLAAPVQAALQTELTGISPTPYPPVVEMAEGDPAVIILGAALIVLIIIGGYLWERQRH